MNKLYAFCALVFLTACGSPDLDGDWVGVGDIKDIRIVISGDKAIIIRTSEDEEVNEASCAVSEGENKSKLICSDEYDDTFVIDISVDGDIMTASPVGQERVDTFVRN